MAKNFDDKNSKSVSATIDQHVNKHDIDPNKEPPLILLGSMNNEVIKERIKSFPYTITVIRAINFTPEKLKVLSNLKDLINIKTIILVAYRLDSEGMKVLTELSCPVRFNLTELTLRLGINKPSDQESDLYRFNSKNIEYIKNSRMFQNLSKLSINCQQGELAEVVKKILEYLPQLESSSAVGPLTINADYYTDPLQEEQLAEFCFQNDKFKIVEATKLFLFNKLKEGNKLLQEVCKPTFDLNQVNNSEQDQEKSANPNTNSLSPTDSLSY